MSTVTDRDKSLAAVSEKYKKNLKKLNEREHSLTMLENKLKTLGEANLNLSDSKTQAAEQWSLRFQSLNAEKEQYQQKLQETQDKLIDTANKLDTTVGVNKSLKDEVDVLISLHKSLRISTSRPSREDTNRDQQLLRERNSESSLVDDEDDSNSNTQDHDSDDDHRTRNHDNVHDDRNSQRRRRNNERDERDEVVILHDSMCKRVNNTLLSREGVNVKKTWAPDMDAMEEALDNTNSKVVVLQAFTRDLPNMSTDEMIQRIEGLVTKAITKSEKVVVSTIIRREDIKDIGLKLNVVNDSLLWKYKDDDRVVTCDNYKLYNSGYRTRDKIHLNEHGIPIFACNLKYSIAKALGVRVMEKKDGRNRNNGGSQRRSTYNDDW